MSTIIEHDTTQHISDIPDFGRVSDVLDLTPKEMRSGGLQRLFLTEDGQVNLSHLKSWCGIKSRATTMTLKQAMDLGGILRGFAEMYHSPEVGEITTDMLFGGNVARLTEVAEAAGVVVSAAEAWGRGEGWLSNVAYTRIIHAGMGQKAVAS